VTSAATSDRHHTGSRSPSNRAGAGLAGITVWGNRRVASRQQISGTRACVESLAIVRSLQVAAPAGELADKKLLGKACANAFSRANRKISEDKSGTAIGLGIVKV
jgi:hypothetical protein